MVKFVISGTEHIFEMVDKSGVGVVQVSCDKNGESFTFWTAEATELPRNLEEAEEMLTKLNWE